MRSQHYMYVWADGIQLNVRLEEAKSCVLVLIGVRADGSKELVALKDGYRESGESWADLLRDCARRDQDQLLTFYDFPAEHWIHLPITNPVESTFATVRLRTKVTRGAGSRTAALVMVFKLADSAQQRWLAVNAPHLVALVRAGARFERGQFVERPKQVAAWQACQPGPPARRSSIRLQA